MLKIRTLCYYVGFISISVALLLQALGIGDAKLVFITANILLIVALLLSLLQSLRQRERQHLIITAYSGTLLILSAQLMKWLDAPNSVYLLAIGSALLLISGVALLIAFITKKPLGHKTPPEVLGSLGISSDIFDKYIGEYENNEIAQRMEIRKQDISLIAQATGQNAFYLQPIEKNIFRFEDGRGGITIEFNGNHLVLHQYGKEFTFTRT
jgi:hypothetical protein